MDRSLGIILMSGYPHSFEVHDAGYELLRKPFSPASLEAALRHAASGARDSAAGLTPPLSVQPRLGV